jgi:quinol-cytochrome oxidoreductase complex cytochrome b subunit
VIPLPELVSELAVGLGTALFAANAFVLLRPYLARQAGTGPPPRPTSTGRVVLNMIVGAVVAVWGLATILSR